MEDGSAVQILSEDEMVPDIPEGSLSLSPPFGFRCFIVGVRARRRGPSGDVQCPKAEDIMEAIWLLRPLNGLARIRRMRDLQGLINFARPVN